MPTGAVGGAPTGRSTQVSPREDADVRRSLHRENEAAQVSAAQGYRVQQNPSSAEVAAARARTGDVGKPDARPDYLVEGRVFDCYSPRQPRKVRGIRSEVAGKVEREQTQRVVLNLSDWGNDLGAVRTHLPEEFLTLTAGRGRQAPQLLSRDDLLRAEDVFLGGTREVGGDPDGGVTTANRSGVVAFYRLRDVDRLVDP